MGPMIHRSRVGRPQVDARRALLVALAATLGGAALPMGPPSSTVLAATDVPTWTNGLVTLADPAGGFWVAEPAPGRHARKLVGVPDAVTCPRWSPDGTGLAFVQDRGSVMVAAADGTGLRELWAGDPGQWPNGPEEAVLDWSPDGSHLLVYGEQARSVWLVPVDGDGEPSKAVPFDADWASWRPDGSGFIVRGMTDDGVVGLIPVSWPDLVVGPPIIETDRDDPGYRIDAGRSDFTWPAVSPDGARILFHDRTNMQGGKALAAGPGRVYVVDADGSHLRPVELDRSMRSDNASFSPDGRRLAMIVMDRQSLATQVAIMTLDGSAPPVTTAAPDAATALQNMLLSVLWSPDGTVLLAVVTDGRNTRTALVDADTGTMTPVSWSGPGPRAVPCDWQRLPA